MQPTYQPEIIEKNIQNEWETNQSFKCCEDSNKEKFYCLSQFPYPSGKLHMGHVRVYAIGDVIARQQRMLGKNVLQPMGWDAFGLPAENAAIKHKVAPAKWTYQNIAQMRGQLKRLGFAYDWSKELATCHPDYYRWEQWLFIKMFEQGLVYQKNAVVNWDPVDKTVLANEQVKDGRGWRSGALVEQREIPQWFLKITDYADELLDELDNLPGWPEQVKTMQRNWIGRSHGTLVEFTVSETNETLEIYTTRADTLYGATYVAIAAGHPLAALAAKDNPDIATFIDACKHTKVAEADLASQEKLGIATGFTAIHPLTGEALPIWIANFVLMNYGSGAVMSVPAHDQRDFEFAQKYQLPIKQVIAANSSDDCDLSQQAYTARGTLIHSGEFDGLTSQDAITQITTALTNAKKGGTSTNYRLRDWGVSRQRYWGAPIPIIHCETCGAVPVPEQDLPIVLPEDIIIDEQGSPLARMPEFYETTCPKCGKAAKRETDTFDTFIESSWYYTRYICKNLDKAILDDRVKYWLPIDTYVGGIEHAVMHLLYSRFFYKVMRDLGLVQSNEPFLKLVPQGMVLKDGAKMSKSKGNVVDPEQLVETYGADTVRLFMMFAAPPEQSLEWSDSGVDGCARYLRKVWQFACDHAELIKNENKLAESANIPLDWDNISDDLSADRRTIYSLLQQANHDYERLQLNTVVSACMKLLNHLQELAPKAQQQNSEQTHYQHLIHRGFAILLSLLGPITPHITQQLWVDLQYGDNSLNAPWPKVIASALKVAKQEYIIQVNGKLRSRISIDSSADKDTIIQAAINDEKTQKHLLGKVVKKTIVVPNKLVNIVVGDA